MKTSVSFNMKNTHWAHWCLCVGNCICSGEKTCTCSHSQLKLHFHCIQHLYLTYGKMIFENFPRWRLFRAHTKKNSILQRENEMSVCVFGQTLYVAFLWSFASACVVFREKKSRTINNPFCFRKKGKRELNSLTSQLNSHKEIHAARRLGS